MERNVTTQCLHIHIGPELYKDHVGLGMTITLSRQIEMLMLRKGMALAGLTQSRDSAPYLASQLHILSIYQPLHSIVLPLFFTAPPAFPEKMKV